MLLRSYLIGSHTFLVQITGLLSQDKLRQALSLLESSIINQDRIIIDMMETMCPDNKEISDYLHVLDPSFMSDHPKRIVFVLPPHHPYRDSIQGHFHKINRSYKLYYANSVEDALLPI